MSAFPQMFNGVELPGVFCLFLFLLRWLGSKTEVRAFGAVFNVSVLIMRVCTYSRDVFLWSTAAVRAHILLRIVFVFQQRSHRFSWSTAPCAHIAYIVVDALYLLVHVSFVETAAFFFSFGRVPRDGGACSLLSLVSFFRLVSTDRFVTRH